MSTPAVRDSETIELLGDFLAEAAEGLAQVEELLAAPPTPDAIAQMFRCFHTLKGNAGFLEVTQVVALAHTVETLLVQYRDGAKPLDAALLFEAVAVHHRVLAGVKTAVEAQAAFAVLPEVEPFVARLTAAISAEAKAAKPEQAETPTVAMHLKETLRVDAERVDTLVEMIGELLVVEAMVADAPEVTAITAPRVRHNLSQLSKISRDLQGLAMRLRMVPLRGLFQKTARILHDLSKKTGKAVALVREGEDVELDRGLVDRLEEPLVHMLRNALDHGVEAAAARAAAGKSAEACVTLRAFHESGRVVIELSDDGRGLQRDAILKRARERNLLPAAAEPTDEEVWNLIFVPGFSTAEQVTELSGRGVGMDVVLRQVQSMQGRVTVSSQAGRGTTVRLSLPLTLAVINGMLVSCGDERYIIPSLSIVESLKPTAKMHATLAQHTELINLRGELLPVVRLDRLVGTEGGVAHGELAVIVECHGKKVALMVNDVLTEQQVVIKPLSAQAQPADFLSGVAILSDGRAGLILDVDRIVGRASSGQSAPLGALA